MGSYVPPTIGLAGLVLPSYNSILQWLLTNYAAIYGATVYLSPEGSDYQFLSILALQASDVDSSLQAVYLSFNPLTAVGVNLDLLGKLIGTARNGATFSTALLTISGTSGTVINNGQAQDVNGNFWNLPPSVTIPSGGTINGNATAVQLGATSANPGQISIIATPTAGWTGVTNPSAAVVGQPVEPDSSYRARLLISQSKPSLTLRAGTEAAVAAVQGVTRSVVYENQYGYTAGYGLVSTAGTAITQIIGYPFDSSDATQSITIITATAIGAATVGASGGTGYAVNDVLTVVQSGGALGEVTVLTLGASNAVATVAVSPTSPGAGYSIANNLATTGGTGSGAQIDITALAAAALAYSIASVGGATSLTTSTSAGTQTNVPYFIGDGIAIGPAHSITAVVEGGTADDIAQTIYNNKNPGVLTNGTTGVVVTDPLNGAISITISFDVLAYVSIYVVLNIHGLSSAFTSATQAAIQAAVLTYLDSLGIGQSVVYSELYGAALSVQTNPLQPTFSIRSISSGQPAAQTTAVLNSTATIVVTASTGIANGQIVVGAGIPPNTTVTDISGAPNIVLSQAATASASGVPVSFFPVSDVDINTPFDAAPSSTLSYVQVNAV